MTSTGQQLHLAIREKKEEEITRLLDRGVDINAMFYGWTPLQLALNQSKLGKQCLRRCCSSDFYQTFGLVSKFTRPTDKLPDKIFLSNWKYFFPQKEVIDGMFTRRWRSVWHDSKVYQTEANFTWICLKDWQPSERLGKNPFKHYINL